MGQEFASIPYAGPAASRYGSYIKRFLVVHCTANDATPAQEAAYARRRTDGVGMHFVSDPSTVLQVLETWYGTGHVGSSTGNRYGISWEFVGFLSSSPAYYRACVDRAADSMRLVLAKLGIPHRWLTDGQLADGVSRGIVTHLQCSRVLGGSTHTDPGPNFPQQYLIDRLNGASMAEWDQSQIDYATWQLAALVEGSDTYRGGPDAGNTVAANVRARQTAEGVAALVARPPVTITDAQVMMLANALASSEIFINRLASAVAEQLAFPTRDERVQEAFEGAQRAEDS